MGNSVHNVLCAVKRNLSYRFCDNACQRMFALALAITANATYPDSSSSHPYGAIQQNQPQWPANGGIGIFEASRMETTTVGSRSKTRHRRRLNAIGNDFRF